MDLYNLVISSKLQKGGGGGSSLPEVTSGDNGKVLTVVDGVWDKADASGKPTMVLYKVDAETGDAIIGTPFEDVYALALAGYPVFVVDLAYSSEDELGVYQLSRIITGDSEQLIFYSPGGSDVVLDSYSVYDPNLHL